MTHGTLKACWSIGLLALCASGPSWSQEDDTRERERAETRRALEQDARERRREREEARQAVVEGERELVEAKRALEEAAREVARLSAGIATPVMRDVERGLARFGARAWLGVTVEDADEGARVIGVTPGSGAADAGIVTGDVIVAVDGAALTESGDRASSEVLVAAMRDVEPEEGVLVSVLRDGEVSELTVLPQAGGFGEHVWRGVRPAVELTMPDLQNLPRILTMRGMFAGPFRELELVSLTPGLGAYFGTDEGLLVVRAPDNEQLELRDGDVILDIGGRTPTSPEHAMRILASFEPEETLRLNIMREQRRETLEFETPAD